MMGRFRRGRGLALVILAGLVLAAGWLVGALHSAYRANQAQLAERWLSLQRYRGIAAQADAVDRWAAEIASGLEDEAFLVGESAGLIGAALQSRIADIANGNGADLTSFRAIEPATKDGLLDLAVEVQLSGRLAGVQATLEGIESAAPLLFVERAEIRASQRASLEGSEEALLDVQLEVHGFMRADAAGGPER